MGSIINIHQGISHLFVWASNEISLHLQGELATTIPHVPKSILETSLLLKDLSSITNIREEQKRRVRDFCTDMYSICKEVEEQRSFRLHVNTTLNDIHRRPGFYSEEEKAEYERLHSLL